MPRLRLELPPSFITVDTDKITPDQMEELSFAVGEAKLRNSAYGKYPMLNGETDEEWQARVEPLFLADQGKQDNETIDDYLKRAFKLSTSKKDLVFETLKSIAECFGQKDKVTKEAFAKTSYVMSKAFIIDILKSCDFPTKDFE